MITPQKPDGLAAKLKTRFLSEGCKWHKARSLPVICVRSRSRLAAHADHQRLVTRCSRRESGLGAMSTDQRSLSSTSFNVTVITPVFPSMSTLPKNCRPKQGARLSPCSQSLSRRFFDSWFKVLRRRGDSGRTEIAHCLQL